MLQHYWAYIKEPRPVDDIIESTDKIIFLGVDSSYTFI